MYGDRDEEVRERVGNEAEEIEEKSGEKEIEEKCGEKEREEMREKGVGDKGGKEMRKKENVRSKTMIVPMEDVPYVDPKSEG